MDTRDFGVLLRNSTGKDVVANKVTVHCKGEEDFQNWLGQTVCRYSIKNLVFVGGSDASRNYPGPTVVQANLKAKAWGGVSVGNICIPSRENEVERLIAKTLSGCSFFTTQILFEPDSIKKIIEEYDFACMEKRIKPAVFFLSFAPAGRIVDVEFFKWLGALIPPGVEKKLVENKQEIGSASVRLAKRLRGGKKLESAPFAQHRKRYSQQSRAGGRNGINP